MIFSSPLDFPEASRFFLPIIMLQETMTYANAITLLRIILIIPFAMLFYIKKPWANWTAALVYVVACATDYFDGLVARHANQVSRLGQFLDPIADKLLITTTLLLLASTQRIEGWALVPALVILARELFISGLREHLAFYQVVVPVSPLAKWKTASQMMSLSCLMVDQVRSVLQEFHDVGISFLWVSAILSIVTGYHYWRTGKETLEGR